MNCEHYLLVHWVALVKSFAVLFIISFSYYGWGGIAMRILGIDGSRTNLIPERIWMGWALSLSLLQFIHLFVPLRPTSVLPLCGCGVILSLKPAYQTVWKKRKKFLRADVFILGATGVAITSWIMSRAMLSTECYDTGLYHLSSVKWMNSFAIIPGLGNLHGRLAFNQSFFMYVASLNVYPIEGLGRSFGNSFLLLLAIASITNMIWPLFQEPMRLFVDHPLKYIAGLFTLPVLGYITLTSDGLTSPSPDMACCVLQIYLLVLLASGIIIWTDNIEHDPTWAVVLVVLALTSITIKLSNIAFSGSLILIGLTFIWRVSASRRHILTRLALLCIIIFAVWCIRGYILSGVPLFPSVLGYIPFDWAMSRPKIQEEANWVYSWARQPGMHYSTVLGNWQWLIPWFRRMITFRETLLYPFALSIAFACAYAVMCWRTKKSNMVKHLKFEVIIIVPIFVGLLYWFMTAPDPRFAHALFWLLPISTALLTLSEARPHLGKGTYATLLVITICALNFKHLEYIYYNNGIIMNISMAGWQTIKSVDLIRQETSSGLMIYTPKRGDQCWDAPLPSAPVFDPALRLRIPGKINSGFTRNKVIQ